MLVRSDDEFCWHTCNDDDASSRLQTSTVCAERSETYRYSYILCLQLITVYSIRVITAAQMYDFRIYS